MTVSIALFLALVPAFAGVDGDGFTVLQGDCNDYDPNVYPGAPEVCDGVDNDCDHYTQASVLELFTLGNGGFGEALAWRPTDDLWYHASGSYAGTQWFEQVDMATNTVMPALVAGTYGPGYVGEVRALTWYPPTNNFLALDNGGNLFQIDPLGQFTLLGPSVWARGMAVSAGSLYAVYDFGPELYEIDPITGVVLNTLTVTLDGQLAQGCQALEVHPVTGVAYAVCTDVTSTTYAYYGSNRAFVELDLLTGAGRIIDNIGLTISAMSIDGNGRILGITEDYSYPGTPETVYEITLAGAGGIQTGEEDNDGDFYFACEECNDAVATAYPGAPEICDGVDSDCDGYLPPDEEDLDGDGVTVCGGDCDDNDLFNTPGRTELCDGQDNDCDGLPGVDEVDGDLDGVMACNDCDDTNPLMYPGNQEICDGLDNNCDGMVQPAESTDDDGDGSPWCDDCDDVNPTNFPGNVEACDGVDNDCDGLPGSDELDNDGDGYLACNDDCDDNNAAVNPGAVEIEDDGIDNNCDGVNPGGTGTGTGTGTDGDGKEGGGGCGCATTSTPSAGWLLLPLLAGLRRRR